MDRGVSGPKIHIETIYWAGPKSGTPQTLLTDSHVHN